MTTVCVVRNGAQVAIAADSQVSFGDTKLPHSYRTNAKLFKVGESYFGMVDATAHFPVLRKARTALPPADLKLTSRDEVFDTFVKPHPQLKEQDFLNPKEEEDDPYESSQFTVLIANRHGLSGVCSYCEVFEFERFWSMGSGRSFALGAMYAGDDKLKTARGIASLGIAAGCEFAKNSAAPVRPHTIELKG